MAFCVISFLYERSTHRHHRVIIAWVKRHQILIMSCCLAYHQKEEDVLLVLFGMFLDGVGGSRDPSREKGTGASNLIG